MSLETCFQTHSSLLMEGAILERIKREFRLVPDEIKGRPAPKRDRKRRRNSGDTAVARRM